MTNPVNSTEQITPNESDTVANSPTVQNNGHFSLYGFCVVRYSPLPR